MNKTINKTIKNLKNQIRELKEENKRLKEARNNTAPGGTESDVDLMDAVIALNDAQTPEAEKIRLKEALIAQGYNPEHYT